MIRVLSSSDRFCSEYIAFKSQLKQGYGFLLICIAVLLHVWRPEYIPSTTFRFSTDWKRTLILIKPGSHCATSVQREVTSCNSEKKIREIIVHYESCAILQRDLYDLSTTFVRVCATLSRYSYDNRRLHASIYEICTRYCDRCTRFVLGRNAVQNS